ncbi:MAG TPA: ATP-binding protein [Candidatus Limnocylindrales bacterium]|nr:ATP-binding protein [Candidatus Limnocylindrales bacterium]
MSGGPLPSTDLGAPASSSRSEPRRLAPEPQPQRIGPSVSFRARLTAGLILSAVVPLAAFGVVFLIAASARSGGIDPTLERIVLFALAAAVILAVVSAYVLGANLLSPLRAISHAVERVSAGDLSARVEVAGEDELARLVDSHNRLASDLERRNRQLGGLLLAIGETSPREGLDRLVRLATASARSTFELIDARIYLGDPGDIPIEEVIPGEARPVRAVLALPDGRLGVLIGHVPATRRWDPADQDLLELYASEVAVGIRNVELFEEVEAQRQKVLELDAAKDDFLRGVSHNLQTPLTSIRAYAEQLQEDRPDHRLSIIVEQSERLYRIVRQLLAVSRLEAGTLRSRPEVLALGPRVRRAWEAMGAAGPELDLGDEAQGWLALADPDQLDQVLWALLDNAVRYGGGSAIHASVRPAAESKELHLTIADEGPGVADADRGAIFERYERGSAEGRTEGTGLGLYVSRSLCRSMGGDLRLEPHEPGRGAAFTIVLPGEPAPAAEA